MREFKGSNGKVFNIRPLTYGEIRALRTNSLDFDGEIEEFCKIQGISLEEIFKWPNPDVVKFHNAVISESFGNQEEAKN